MRGVAVVLAGLGLAAAFLSQTWWPAVAAVAVFVTACHGRRPRAGFGYGLLFGLAAYVPTMSWLGAAVGGDAGLLLAAYSALWLGLAGTGTALVSRLRLWWLWTPAVWLLVEAVGGRVPFGGWGWGRVGLTQSESPLLPLAALGGVPALTFAVVLVAACCAAVAVALRTGVPGAGLAPAAAVVVVALLSNTTDAPTGAEASAGPASRQVGLIQGNVPQPGLDFNARRQAVLNNHVQETRRLASQVAGDASMQPDLVLWPENSSDIDPFRNPAAHDLISTSAQTIGAPILVGAVVQESDDDDRYVRNVGIVWDPVTGPGDRYTKRNLVPFGEYVPFRSILAQRISRFDRVPRDFLPGDASGALDIGGTRVGVAICFDVAFDDAMRDAVREGARMLVVQTNNATFNGTSQPAQQFAISRIRAVEHGRSVAVVSTSGISGVIAPDGSVQQGTLVGELVPASYSVPVPQRDTLTVADRLGGWPEFAVALLALAVLLAARRRSQGSAAADGVEPLHDVGSSGRH